MSRILVIVLSFISMHECNQFEDIPSDSDPTCLLQSYIVPKFSNKRIQEQSNDWETQVSRPHSKNPSPASYADFPAASFVEISSSRSLRTLDVDQTGQIMIGLLLLLIMGAVVGLGCALAYSDNFMKGEGDEYDHLQGDHGRHEPIPSSTSLNPSLVVPPRHSVVYDLPDISQQRKPLESFSVLDKNGRQILGVIVKEGNDDPGILLHGMLSTGVAGAPMAFIGTHPEAIRTRQLRIAWPSTEHPRGEMFAMLELDGDAFRVVRERQKILQIEGGMQGFVLSSGSGERVGKAGPAGNGIELHLQGGADAALAVLCTLVAVQLSASS